MRHVMKILFAALLGFTQTTLGAEAVLRGEVYAAEGGTQPAYAVELGSQATADGRVFFGRFTDSNGQPIASVEATYVSGRLSSVHFEQRQANEVSTAEVQDGKVRYTHTSGGVSETSTDSDPGDFVAFPAIPDHIVTKWDELHAGKTTQFTAPIPARRMGLRFRVSKDKTWSEGDQTFTQFKMAPTNPVYRALGNPIVYVFEHRGRSLVEFRGGTTIRTGDPKDMKNFAARIVYRP